MRILIEGDRAEGKTMLGITIYRLLKNFTRHNVTLEETNAIEDMDERLERAIENTQVSDVCNLSPRRVQIVVLNTKLW